jgi:phosphoribosylformimino-5-aminoimidazole carboxamide ribotide isomerase
VFIYPAIDLFAGKAVRLFKGDYAQMTVYSDNPVSVAKDFQEAGSRHIHLVDLEGAKSGIPENLATI